MKKQSILKNVLCLLVAMVCMPLAMQAKVEHLLPKVHLLKETNGTPFALQRAVTIAYDGFEECVLLENMFKGMYGKFLMALEHHQVMAVSLMVSEEQILTVN